MLPLGVRNEALSLMLLGHRRVGKAAVCLRNHRWASFSYAANYQFYNNSTVGKLEESILVANTPNWLYFLELGGKISA